MPKTYIGDRIDYAVQILGHEPDYWVKKDVITRKYTLSEDSRTMFCDLYLRRISSNQASIELSKYYGKKIGRQTIINLKHRLIEANYFIAENIGG